MRKAKYILAGLLCFALVGCGGGSGSAYESVSNDSYIAGESYGVAGGMKNASLDSYDTAYETESNQSSPIPEAKKEETKSQSEKIVYTSDVTLESLKYDDTLSGIRSLIQKYDGFIQSENEYDNGGLWYSEDYRSYRTMNLTVRIPTSHFDEFLDGIEENAHATSKSKNADNITREYNDMSAQIKALEVQEDRLLDMMEKANTIEDMINVENRLTEVQSKLNRFKTQLSIMDSDVDYSTINVTLREVRRYTDTKRPYLERLRDAFGEGFDGFKTFLGNIILFLAESWIFLLFFAGVIYGAVKLLKRRSGKRKEKIFDSNSFMKK